MKRVLPYLLLLVAVPAWAQFKTPGQRAHGNLGPAVTAATNAANSATTTANTAAALAKGKALPSLPAMSPPSVNGSVARVGADLDFSRPSLALKTHVLVANTAPGTVLNQWAILSGSPSMTTVALTTTTGGVEGICTGGCGSIGSAQIQNGGFASCAFDGATTAGDYVGLSTSVGGKCTDIGVSQPVGILTVGRVYSTNAGAGTYLINMLPPDVVNAAGGGVNIPSQAGNDTLYSGSGAVVSGRPNIIHAGGGTLYAALAACPVSGVPCTIVADPGRTYTLASQFILGRTNSGAYALPQTLVNDGATINCTDTSAPEGNGLDDCIILGQKARYIGTAYGAIIQASSTASLNSIMTTFGGVYLDIWQAGHTYRGGQLILDANGDTEEVTTPTPGSAATAVSQTPGPPSWPANSVALGTTTSDGGVTWTVIANSSEIPPHPKVGTGGTRVSIRGGDFIGSTSTGAFVRAIVHISALDGFGFGSDLTTGGITNGGTGLWIDDGSTNDVCTALSTPFACCLGPGTGTCASGGTLTNQITIDGLWVAPGVISGGTTAGPLYGMRVSSENSGTVGVNCLGCAVVDLEGTGNIATISIDATNANLVGTNFFEPYVELHGTSNATDGILINNARGTTLVGGSFDHNTCNTPGPTCVTNCLHIKGVNLDAVSINTRVFGSTCVNGLINDLSGRTLGAGNVNYTYTNTGNNAPVFDGLELNGGINNIATPLTLSVSGTYALPAAALTMQKFIWAAAGVTETLPLPSYVGQVLNGVVCQNGTGGFTPAFAAIGGLTIDGTFPAFTTQANKCGNFSLWYDTATHAYLMGSATLL